jgi:hypothetical protein
LDFETGGLHILMFIVYYKDEGMKGDKVSETCNTQGKNEWTQKCGGKTGRYEISREISA